MTAPGWVLAMAADVVLVVHAAFVAFVVLGGLAVLRVPSLALLHLPAVAWGVLVETTGWICPLTPIEVALRRQAGEAGYAAGFVEHYLLAALYPDGLTRGIQVMLGLALLALNAAVYAALWRRRRTARSPRRPAAAPD